MKKYAGAAIGIMLAAIVWLWLYHHITEQNEAADAALLAERSRLAQDSTVDNAAPVTPTAQTPAALVDKTPDAPPPTSLPVAVAAAPAPPPVIAPVPAAPAPPKANLPTAMKIVYKDNFHRAGDLAGSSPDTKNTNGAKWTVSSGPGTYTTKPDGLHDNVVAYDAAFLPVNGTSGITLDGKQSFTLSATLSPDSAGNWLGISLNTHGPDQAGHNIFDGGITALTIGYGHAMAYKEQTILKYDPFGDSIKMPYSVSISYHAANNEITYSIGDSVIATLPGVKPEQIAALSAVALGNGSCASTANITDFTLSVGGTD